MSIKAVVIKTKDKWNGLRYIVVSVIILSLYTAYYIFLNVVTDFINYVKVCIMIAGRLGTI